MRYDLKTPVRHDGVALDAIVLRTATRKDQEAILRAAKALDRERGRPLTDRDFHILAIAQLADLPREAVLKLAVSDAIALARIVSAMSLKGG